MTVMNMHGPRCTLLPAVMTVMNMHGPQCTLPPAIPCHVLSPGCQVLREAVILWLSELASKCSVYRIPGLR